MVQFSQDRSPLDLLTDDERRSVENARKIKRSLIDNGEGDETGNKDKENKDKERDPSVIITEGNKYMDPSDF